MTTLDTLRIRCESSLKKSLDELARKQQRTMSNLALHVLIEYVRQHTEEEVLTVSKRQPSMTPDELEIELRKTSGGAGRARRETQTPRRIIFVDFTQKP